MSLGTASSRQAEPQASAEDELPAQPAGTAHSSLGPFNSVSYRYLFVGTALTMTGYFMQQVAQGWLVYELTSSPTWLGFVSFASGLPMLLLALPAGVLSDRLDRQKLLMVAQGLTVLVAIVLAALVATDLVQPWHVIATSFTAGCLFVLINPTRQALIPATVKPAEISSAVPLMSTAQNCGRIVGPALTGVLIAALGAATAFGVQAVGFILALVCAALMTPQPVAVRARERTLIQNLMEGLRYVRGDPTVFTLIVLQAIPALLIMPYQQLLPIFARDILHTGPEGLGALAMAVGIGAIVGSLGAVVLPPHRQRISLLISLFTFGLLLAAFAASTWFPLSLALMGLIGVSQSIYLATNNTLVQLATTDAFRGRVMSIYLMMWGLMPIGSLPQGVLADHYGAPLVTACCGLASCVIVLIVAVRTPALRQL